MKIQLCTLTLVVETDVREEFGSRGHTDPLLVSQFVESALLGQDTLPVHAVGRAARHRAQQKPVDLNDLLYSAGADVHT